MGDLRNDLERIGRRVEPTVDGLGRLERRRRTKERNRRVAAGALALLVAVGGSIAAYAALREPDRAGIAVGTSGPSGAELAPALARRRTRLIGLRVPDHPALTEAVRTSERSCRCSCSSASPRSPTS
jgi:hypothetical protein